LTDLSSHPEDVGLTRARELFNLIVGKKLTEMVRVLDMQMFRIGETYQRTAEYGRQKGEVIDVSEFSIHVQCPWRVSHGTRIVLGQHDRFFPVPGSDGSVNIIEPEENTPRWLERQVCELFRAQPDGLSVLGVAISELGDLEIRFEGDYLLSIFPAASIPGTECENWRLVSEASHLVAYTARYELS
jgi:hypothetical protein